MILEELLEKRARQAFPSIPCPALDISQPFREAFKLGWRQALDEKDNKTLTDHLFILSENIKHALEEIQVIKKNL